MQKEIEASYLVIQYFLSKFQHFKSKNKYLKVHLICWQMHFNKAENMAVSILVSDNIVHLI